MDLRRRLFLLPLLFGAAAMALLFVVPGTQAGGAVLIGPVPVAVGTSPAAAALALLLLLGLYVVITGRMLRAGAEAERERRVREPPPSALDEPAKAEVRGAGVIMIGPVPVALGNDPRLLRFTLALAALLTGLGLAAMLLGRA